MQFSLILKGVTFLIYISLAINYQRLSLRLSNSQCFQETLFINEYLSWNHKFEQKASKTVNLDDFVLVKETLSYCVLIPTPTGLWCFRFTCIPFSESQIDLQYWHNNDDISFIIMV